MEQAVENLKATTYVAMQLAEVGIFFPDSINMVSALRSGLMVHS